MTRSTLVRAGGLAAIAGGVLRAAASFAPVVIDSAIARESLYIVVDVCLTMGLLGFNARHSKSIGWLGAIGLALALAGLATVRANRVISTVDLYPAGALATACGVILLTARAWVARRIPGWVPVAFLLSTLVGLIGSYVRGATALFVWSGVIFGVAFAGLGIEMWKSASNSRLHAASAGDSQPGRRLLQPHSEQTRRRQFYFHVQVRRVERTRPWPHGWP